VVPALTEFRDVRKTHLVGPDVCGTGHAALNFTGSAGAAGEAWIAVYDQTPADNSVENLYSSVNLSTDLLFRSFNNKKGAGVMALLNEGAADKGLAVVAYDNGNTDTLVLGTSSERPADAAGAAGDSFSRKRCRRMRVVQGRRLVLGQRRQHHRDGARLPAHGVE
jgi:hypothetical protein